MNSEADAADLTSRRSHPWNAWTRSRDRGDRGDGTTDGLSAA